MSSLEDAAQLNTILIPLLSNILAQPSQSVEIILQTLQVCNILGTEKLEAERSFEFQKIAGLVDHADERIRMGAVKLIVQTDVTKIRWAPLFGKLFRREREADAAATYLLLCLRKLDICQHELADTIPESTFAVNGDSADSLHSRGDDGSFYTASVFASARQSNHNLNEPHAKESEWKRDCSPQYKPLLRSKSKDQLLHGVASGNGIPSNSLAEPSTTVPDTINRLTTDEKKMMTKRAQKITQITGEALPENQAEANITTPAIYYQQVLKQKSDQMIEKPAEDGASDNTSVMTADTIHVSDTEMQRRKFEKICAFLGEIIEPSEMTNEVARVVKTPMSANERKYQVHRSDKLEKLFGQVPPATALANAEIPKHRRSILRLGLLMNDSNEMMQLVHEIQGDAINDTNGLDKCSSVEDFAQYLQDLIETNLIQIIERGVMDETNDEEVQRSYQEQLSLLRMQLARCTSDSTFRFNAMVVEACRDYGKSEEETEMLIEELKESQDKDGDRQAKRKQMAKLEAFFGDKIKFPAEDDNMIFPIPEDPVLEDELDDRFPETDNDLAVKEKRTQTKRAKKLAMLLGQAIPEETIKQSLSRNLIYSDAVSVSSSLTEGYSNASESSLLVKESEKELQRRKLAKLSNFLGERIREDEVSDQAAGPIKLPMSEEERKLHIKRSDKLAKVFGEATPQQETVINRAATHRASIRSISDMMLRPADMVELIDLFDDEEPASKEPQESDVKRKKIRKLHKFFGDPLGVETMIEHHIISVLEQRINTDDLPSNERADLQNGIRQLRKSLHESSAEYSKLTAMFARRNSDTPKVEGLHNDLIEETRGRSHSYQQNDMTRKLSTKRFSKLSERQASKPFITKK